ncbi:MAG: response regulator, partial [Kiritimatiellae bacterium]|nr:response regulator [Kiritimatiellia bacterium]
EINMKTILVIDDEPAILKYLKTILSGLGYAVRTACDGSSGFKEAKNNDVNLIVSDVNLPGEISGMDAIKKLRALRPECPIIILSGYPSEDRLKEAEELNVEFLTKPFEIPFLATLLKRLLPIEAQPVAKATSQK